MKYTELVTSGLRVSRVGIGNMSWPGCFWGEAPPQPWPANPMEGREMVATALDLGITLFDTAEAYGRGFAEEALGCALATPGRRDRAVIVTKVGPLFGAEVIGERTCNLSPAHIRQRCEQSLRRLRTDRIDLYLAHWPDPATPIEETVDVMQSLIAEGKIRAFGVSNFDETLLARALVAGAVAVNQLPFSLVDRRIEREVVRVCRNSGVGVLAYSPIGKGLLSGKYEGEEALPAGDYRHGMSEFAAANLARHRKLVAYCRGVAARLGVSPVQIALAWALTRPGITAVLPGPKSIAQLEDCARAADLALGDDVLAALDLLSGEPAS